MDVEDHSRTVPETQPRSGEPSEVLSDKVLQTELTT